VCVCVCGCVCVCVCVCVCASFSVLLFTFAVQFMRDQRCLLSPSTKDRLLKRISLASTEKENSCIKDENCEKCKPGSKQIRPLC